MCKNEIEEKSSAAPVYSIYLYTQQKQKAVILLFNFFVI